MKKINRRNFLKIMGSSAAAAGLAACGSASQGAASSASGASSAAAKKETVNLVMWGIGKTPEDIDEWQKVVNAYTEEKIGVTIDLKISNWGDWEQKMTTIVNSGEAFDIMFTNDKLYTQQVSTGAFADITDLAPSVAADLFSFIPEAVWDGAKVDGRIYSVPTYKDSSITQYWMFDDKYVQKYGIDMTALHTMDDLDEPFRKMKEGEGDTFYPLQLAQGAPFNGFFYQYYDNLSAGLEPIGVALNDTGRKVVCTLEQEDIRHNLELLHKWYQDGLINPDAPTLVEQAKGLAFNSAQGFPGAEVRWQTIQGVEKFDTKQVFGPMYTTASIRGSLNAISANSKYVEEALAYLQLLNTDHKLRDMFAYGIEGKHFEYVSENVVHRMTDTFNRPPYSQGTFFTLSTEDTSPADQWEQVRKLNEQATNSVCLGYSLDMTNVQMEVANCKTIWEKYRYEMMAGASDPAEAVPQCVQELKSGGMDTIIQEAQKQIDASFAK